MKSSIEVEVLPGVIIEKLVKEGKVPAAKDNLVD